jgi:hypothetical protein
MRCRIDPGFVATTREPRYFTRWLEPWELGWKTGDRWEVICLDEKRHFGASVQFGPKDTTETIQKLELPVPIAVLDVARSGIGGYCDELGRVVETSV